MLRVTPQMLVESSRTVSGKASEIDSSLASLGSHVQSLTAEWEGQAQGQFTGLYAQWQTSARQLHDALNGISQLLNAAGITYEDSESQIARMFTAS